MSKKENLWKAFSIMIACALGLSVTSDTSRARTAATLDVPVATAGQPEVYFVPNVVEQFNKLALRPDGLAFGIGDSPDPTTFKHYQGMARTHGPGPPYVFISRSGNDPICAFCNHDYGNLLIVRMGSRDASGERFRTNRLIRDWVSVVRDANGEPVLDENGDFIPWTKPPDPRDTTVADITFNGEDGWPSYGHPGGMQLVGDVLAVALETPYEGDPANLILFLDVSNPETPTRLSSFAPEPGTNYSAGLIGLTPVTNQGGEGVRYLMITTGGNNHDVRLYRSLSTDPANENGATDLKSENIPWELLRSINKDEIESCSGGAEWPEGNGAYQSLNFVRQQSLNGPLFVVGARNTFPGTAGSDFLDLYEVNVDAYGNPEQCMLSRSGSRQVTSYPYNGHGDSANLAAASGTYVSPSGELVVYGTEYENDGPFEIAENGLAGRRTVRFVEWRHRDMVRADSPTLRPTIETPGLVEVDEGSSVTLAGQGRGALSKAWIQLFEDDGAGSSLPDFLDDDAWMAIDYEDWGKDNFDDFSQFDARTDTEFNDNAGSWRWFAPSGCTIRANEDQFFATTGVFPGSHTKTLYGDGSVHQESDLDAVPSDVGGGRYMNDVISSVQFFPTAEVDPPFPDCHAYYNAQIGVAWDFDLNGSFETVGQNPPFSASELDGPVVRTVNARGQHPTDTTSLGHSPPTAVNITVRNVAPRVSSLKLVDSLGRTVGTDVPFALVGLEYTIQGSFTDPGKPDHQTATLNLGDGTTVSSSAFDAFSDAFGGVTGQLRKRHRYNTPGTYTLRLDVLDDDGGQTTAAITVNVVSPIGALQAVVGEIDLLLATATNSHVIRALRDAREDLAGYNNGAGHNGAIDHLQRGNFVAALFKIEDAIKAFWRAEAAGGGDLARLKYALGLASAAIAEVAYSRALAHVGSPSQAEGQQLERIRQSISAGHARLGEGTYVAAVDEFKDAATRAACLEAFICILL